MSEKQHARGNRAGEIAKRSVADKASEHKLCLLALNNHNGDQIYRLQHHSFLLASLTFRYTENAP